MGGGKGLREGVVSFQTGYTFCPQRSCHVVNEGCAAPPALVREPGSRIAECFRCGNDVCKQCSRVRDYLNYGRRRLCAHCIEDRSKRPIVILFVIQPP